MNVLELGERTLLEMDARLVDAVCDALDKYKFAEKVTIASRLGQLHQIALHGPDSSQILSLPSDLAPLCATTTTLFDTECIIWRDDPAAVPGLYLILPIEQVTHVWGALLEQFGQSTQLGKRLLRPIG